MTPKRLTLKRKTEIALCAFIATLRKDNPSFRKYRPYEGSQADERKTPCFIVEAMGAEEITPFGPKSVSVEIMLVTQIDDSDDGAELPSTSQRRRVRARHDDALALLDELLDGVASQQQLKLALNKGATKRPVVNFNFYDITKTDERHAFEGRCFVDLLSFSVIASAFDPTFAVERDRGQGPITVDSDEVTVDNG